MKEKKDRIFSKDELDTITALMQYNPASEVARHFGLTDNDLTRFRKKNKQLDAALVKGVASRSAKFAQEQIQKNKHYLKDSYQFECNSVEHTSYFTEEDAFKRYREIVQERRLKKLKEEAKHIDIL